MAKRILIAACIFLGAGLILFMNWPGVRNSRPEPPSVPVNVGGTFTLTDTDGNAVTEEILKDHYSLVYFGFTRCPDVCPISLQNITDALDIAGPPAETVLPIFITIDPENDTPEVMKAYTSNFHARFMALTGPPQAVKQTADAYKVYARATPGSDSGAFVHSDPIYLIGPDGKYVAQFGGDSDPTDIAARLRREMYAP